MQRQSWNFDFQIYISNVFWLCMCYVRLYSNMNAIFSIEVMLLHARNRFPISCERLQRSVLLEDVKNNHAHIDMYVYSQNEQRNWKTWNSLLTLVAFFPMLPRSKIETPKFITYYTYKLSIRFPFFLKTSLFPPYSKRSTALKPIQGWYVCNSWTFLILPIGWKFKDITKFQTIMAHTWSSSSTNNTHWTPSLVRVHPIAFLDHPYGTWML